MHDDENNDSKMSGGGSNDAYDFTRRRVAGILRREKPRYEQDRAQTWFAFLYWCLHDRNRDAFGVIQIGKLEVITYNLFGKIKTYRVIPLTKRPLPAYFLRKPSNSNLYSRFFTPPCGR